MNSLHSIFLILLCAGTVVGEDSSTTAKNSPWAFWNKEIAKTLAAKNTVEVHMAEKNKPTSLWEQFTVTSKDDILFFHRILKDYNRRDYEDIYSSVVRRGIGQLEEFSSKETALEYFKPSPHLRIIRHIENNNGTISTMIEFNQELCKHYHGPIRHEIHCKNGAVKYYICCYNPNSI